MTRPIANLIFLLSALFLARCIAQEREPDDWDPALRWDAPAEIVVELEAAGTLNINWNRNGVNKPTCITGHGDKLYVFDAASGRAFLYDSRGKYRCPLFGADERVPVDPQGFDPIFAPTDIEADDFGRILLSSGRYLFLCDGRLRVFEVDSYFYNAALCGERIFALNLISFFHMNDRFLIKEFSLFGKETGGLLDRDEALGLRDDLFYNPLLAASERDLFIACVNSNVVIVVSPETKKANRYELNVDAWRKRMAWNQQPSKDFPRRRKGYWPVCTDAEVHRDKLYLLVPNFEDIHIPVVNAAGKIVRLYRVPFSREEGYSLQLAVTESRGRLTVFILARTPPYDRTNKKEILIFRQKETS